MSSQHFNGNGGHALREQDKVVIVRTIYTWCNEFENLKDRILKLDAPFLQ